MEDRPVIIGTSHVTIRFNLVSQKVDNLKKCFIKLVREELMFQGSLATKDVSFQIHAGESWGIIGVNGSGKSTLLKVVSGILKPCHGSITVEGNIAPLIKLGTGFNADMTARENIFLNGRVLGHTEKYMKEHFDEIIDFVELQDLLDSPIRDYSSGMRARLGFAIATMIKSNILIVGEILAVNDYKFHRKHEQRMSAMLGGGTTLFYVLHPINEVRRPRDHVIQLEKRAVCQIGGTQEACDEYIRCMSIKQM